MKRYLLYISFLLLSSQHVWSQQTEHYTQYQFNQFNFNPSLAGTKSCIDIRTGYRFQWLGIDGAPETGFANLHGPLRFRKKRRHLYGPKSGIGVSFNRDSFGPFSFIKANLSYALHLPINKDWTFSLGTSVGMQQASFSTNNLTAEFNDPTLPSSSQSFILFPDIAIGGWIADKKHYLGVSVKNLVGNQLNAIGPESFLQRHFYITGGKKFKLEKKWSFVPSVFLLKTARTPLDFHLSALFDLDNKVSFSMGIRRTDAITAQVRVKLFNFISIGYSFDYIISKLNRNMWYTHEITAAFNSCSNYGSSSTTTCPTFE